MSDGGQDDDWFEGALDDETEPSGDESADRDADGDSAADAPVSGRDAETAAGGEDAPADGDADASFGGGGDSPFGDTGTGGDPFAGGEGFGDAGGDGGAFDEEFEEAMGSSDGGDFDDEDFDSDIPRLDLGIAGLDGMIQGGVPRRHLMVVIGSAGTGKTTFGLQFLRHGLVGDDTEKGVFITLEQSYEDIMATANERGWEFERHVEAGDLAVIDLDPVEMANSLDNIRGELPELIEDFGADRLVLDSVSLLEMMYDDQASRRTEVFDFTQSLKDAGVTTVFTSEASEDSPYASRHGIIEYLTDAVFLLRYVRSDSTETRLAVEIQKIRNANHSRETKPYDITADGISVYNQGKLF